MRYHSRWYQLFARIDLDTRRLTPAIAQICSGQRHRTRCCFPPDLVQSILSRLSYMLLEHIKHKHFQSCRKLHHKMKNKKNLCTFFRLFNRFSKRLDSKYLFPAKFHWKTLTLIIRWSRMSFRTQLKTNVKHIPNIMREKITRMIMTLEESNWSPVVWNTNTKKKKTMHLFCFPSTIDSSLTGVRFPNFFSRSPWRMITRRNQMSQGSRFFFKFQVNRNFQTLKLLWQNYFRAVWIHKMAGHCNFVNRTCEFETVRWDVNSFSKLGQSARVKYCKENKLFLIRSNKFEIKMKFQEIQ